eukprot:gnl/Spiro4/29845_TR14670_c0_g1_i1.p1 gnl/Spiro4/29845_TR14670_c0_g1~~gnl/Spiro4/29845_TR14670_c0_g1_i1.p1  ORF type:complete len:192 (+),score=14.59 gnl/Spiro4/29845_TR14670_c0_g1_i1:42-578(+)
MERPHGPLLCLFLLVLTLTVTGLALSDDRLDTLSLLQVVDMDPACDDCVHGFSDLRWECDRSSTGADCQTADSDPARHCPQRPSSQQTNYLCRNDTCRRMVDRIYKFNPNRFENVDDVYTIREEWKQKRHPCDRMRIIFDYCSRAVSSRSPDPVCKGAEDTHFCRLCDSCPNMQGQHA